LKDKALVIIIAMYGISIAMLGTQFLADSYGTVITSPINGVPIKSALHGFINDESLSQYTQSITEANFQGNSTYYDKVETFTTAGAFVVWELITLMSGTYIFYVLLLFGVPLIFVLIFIMLYAMLLARAIIGYLSKTN